MTMSLETAWQLLGAMLCGALVGMEREFVGLRRPHPPFAGVRTMTLIALLGALSTQLGAQLGWWLPAMAFSGLILLVGISHFRSQAEDPGLTTEVVGLLSFLIGVTMAQGAARVAVAVTIVITALLSIKTPLHEFARRLTEADINATLKFAIVSLVILPLLPNQGFGPHQVLNPYQIWWMVVLISGISFLGYILIQLAGPARGLVITGLLGGLVSSTAVTLSAAQRSRTSPALSLPLALSVLTASTVLFPRILIVVAVINPSLLRTLAIPLCGMAAVGAGACALLRRQAASAPLVATGVELTNPFLLREAVRFGALFSLVLVAVELAQARFGALGLYVAGMIAGLADLDAITLSMARMSAGGTAPLVAARTVVVASVANTAVKAAFLWAFGGRATARPATPGFVAVLLSGVLALIAMV